MINSKLKKFEEMPLPESKALLESNNDVEPLTDIEPDTQQE
jgi:hypothetical protein